MIEKLKPEWQKGRLNGVGGKVEEGEDPFDAMVREFREETGVEMHAWEHLADMGNVGVWNANENEWDCQIYWAKSYHYINVQSTTDEKVGIYKFNDVVTNQLDVLPNLRFLVPLARFFDGTGLNISYDRS